MRRLVTVSNRILLPKNATVAGGLAVGVLGALGERGGLWFGWNGETTECEVGAPSVTSRDGISFASIPLTRALYDSYYSGFANATLWPLFHYFLSRFRYEETEYVAYKEANDLFARRLVPLLRPEDLIWVHDYHLIPLAERLRAIGVGQPMGFFLHIPFPHFEVLRALPPYVEILRALLTYDIVGFQTEVDQQAFLECVRSACGTARIDVNGTVSMLGCKTRTGVFPIGVDVDATMRSAVKASASVPVQRLVQGLGGRRLIIGADRLDYSKGLLERFLAYRSFLEDFPSELGRVTFLQIAPLGRQDVQAYSQIRDALEQSSGRTNGRFADADWTPVRYLNRNFPHAILMGFLRAAQVCLVTPLRDGMNLVAKEFIAAQQPTNPGVLVLSDRAGAACELTDALLVNPYDTKGIARAIQAALTMPRAERRSRHQRLLLTLRKHDIHRWHTQFVNELIRCTAGRLSVGRGSRSLGQRVVLPNSDISSGRAPRKSQR